MSVADIKKALADENIENFLGPTRERNLKNTIIVINY